jgi:hypothetical protein
VCARVAEIGQHAVAHELGNEAVVGRHHSRAGSLIGEDDLAHVLGIKFGGQPGRAHKVTEHHGELAALGEDGSSLLHSGGGGCIGIWGGWWAQLGNGTAKAQPMARARHPNVLQRLIIDLREQVHVDVVGLEGIGVLREADCLKPSSDIAHAESCSSSNLAPWRTGVSKPSVNQL